MELIFFGKKILDAVFFEEKIKVYGASGKKFIEIISYIS